MRTSMSEKKSDNFYEKEDAFKSILDNDTKDMQDDLVDDSLYEVEDEPFKGFNRISKEVDDAISKEEPFKGFNNISDEVDNALEIENLRSMDRVFEDERIVLGKVDLEKDFSEVLGDATEEEVEDDSDEYDDSTEENTEDESNEETRSTNSNKIKKILIGAGVLAGVTILGVVGYNAFSNSLDISNAKDMEDSILELYTNDKKEDIRDGVSSDTVDKYLSKLDDIDMSDDDKTSLKNELKTISYFISDDEIVDSITDNSYDYNNSSTSDKLDKVKESAKTYSVSPLAVTMTNNVSKAEEDYNYFISLRDELSTIKDYINFDYEGYQKKVNNVTHKVNKEELQDMVDELYNAKVKAEEVEELKEKATEEALKKAEELQKETEDKLNDARDDLNTYKEETKSFFESLFSGFGNKSEDEDVQQNSELNDVSQSTEEQDESESNGILNWFNNLFK